MYKLLNLHRRSSISVSKPFHKRMLVCSQREEDVRQAPSSKQILLLVPEVHRTVRDGTRHRVFSTVCWGVA